MEDVKEKESEELEDLFTFADDYIQRLNQIIDEWGKVIESTRREKVNNTKRDRCRRE